MCIDPKVYNVFRMIEVYLNNNPISINENSSLLDLLSTKGLDNKKGIAVAIDQSIVSKKEWSSTRLSDQNKIVIITATQGG